MDISRFYTHSLQDPGLARILAAALQAVDPAAAVERYLAAYPLPPARRIYALALGKAAVPMAHALARSAKLVDVLVITKHAAPLGFAPARLLEGNHPIPGEGSLAAGQAALEFVSSLEADDLLVCLISGGGSALMTAPRLPMDDLRSLTAALLASGARIDEINTLRRRLDWVKGGGLAQVTRARVLSLILSDVVGSPLEAIASGPTAPDPTTRADALAVLEKYHLQTPLLDMIRTAPETPKPGDPLFERVQNVIVGDNRLAAQAALQAAEDEGYVGEYLGSAWQGEAREVGARLAEMLVQAAHTRRKPVCMVAGGETTVTLHGQGRGGRNQELALAAVPLLDGVENTLLITLATDGEDGPTEAAGAVVSADSLPRARALGLDPLDFLDRNDSYSFFQALGDLLITHPTGTNVNDLTFLFSTGKG